jgi:hypothetical protein
MAKINAFHCRPRPTRWESGSNVRAEQKFPQDHSSVRSLGLTCKSRYSEDLAAIGIVVGVRVRRPDKFTELASRLISDLAASIDGSEYTGSTSARCQRCGAFARFAARHCGIIDASEGKNFEAKAWLLPRMHEPLLSNLCSNVHNVHDVHQAGGTIQNA